jgi:cytochrome c biogenesis protein CcmG/thiol:disulfide interchange protein DsbE
MMKKVLTAFVLLAALLVFLPLARAGDAREDAVFPPFTLTTMDGRTIDSADLRGTPLFVNVMATWCPPCKREAPDVERAWREFKGKVQFIGIFVASGDRAMEDFVEKYDLTFPAGKDPGIVGDLNLVAFPVGIFVTPGGKIAKMHYGGITYEELKTSLEEILKEGD